MKNIILILSLIITTTFATNSVSTQLEHQKYLYAQKAAEEGNVKAQFDLALMYATGSGVNINESLAFKYFHKAARNNHVKAMFFMGLSFAEGKGVRQQKELARYWFKLAAKAGYRDAIAHLASIEQSLVQQGKIHSVAFNQFAR